MSTAPAPQQSLGDAFHCARAATGLSIAQVEAATNIRASYIRALEEELFQDLPPDIYLKRILSTLASFYGLEALPLLRQFHAEREAFLRREQQFQRFHLDAVSHRNHPVIPVVHGGFVHAHRVAAIAGFSLVVAALLGYVAVQVRTFSAAPTLVLEQPTGDLHVAHRTTLVRGRVDTGAQVRVNNQEVLTDEAGSFEVTYELSRGENVIDVVAQGKNGRVSRVTRTVSADFPEPVVSAEPSDGFVATVRATDRTWVRVTLDGETRFEGILDAEQGEVFRGMEQIEVRAGNAGAARVAINGRDRGAIGKSGATGSFVYTEPSAVGLVGTTPPVR